MSQILDAVVEQIRIVITEEQNGDSRKLQEANTVLEQIASQNLPEFMFALAQTLANTSNNAVVRQAAGVYLKNCLFSKEENAKLQFRERWLLIDASARDQIKDLVVDSLATDTSSPSQAAQCVACIACTELPANQWHGIISKLTTNIANGDVKTLRETSLEALGYICEELDFNHLLADSKAILSAVVDGMKKEEMNAKVRLLSAIVFGKCLAIFNSELEKEAERYWILTTVCEAAKFKDDSRIRVAALQNLVKIVSMYYQYMEAYMEPDLLPIMVDAMTSEEDAVAITAIEFWSVVCDVENRGRSWQLSLVHHLSGSTLPRSLVINRNYIQGFLPLIVPPLCTALTRQREDDPECEWTVSKAAGMCLTQITKCTRFGLHNDKTVPEFISANIGNADWRFREAAVYALGALVPEYSVSRMEEIFKDHLERLMQLVVKEDEMLRIRNTAVWTLTRYCCASSYEVRESPLLKTIFETLVKGLEMEPWVAVNVCWALHSLVEPAHFDVTNAKLQPEKETLPTHWISASFPLVLEKLILTTGREDSQQNNLKNTAFQIIARMVFCAPKDCHEALLKLFPLFLQQLERALQEEVSPLLPTIGEESSGTSLVKVVERLCTALQGLLTWFKESILTDLCDQVMQAVEMILKSSLGSNEEVQFHTICTVGVVVTVLKEKSVKYLEPLKLYLLQGLRAVGNYEVCAITVKVLGDLCLGLKSQFSALLNDVMPILMQNLSDPNCHSMIKPHILSAIGDIALAVGSDFKPYLETSLKMLEQVTKIEVDKDNKEMVQHLDSLRTGCLEAYTGILCGLKGEKEEESCDVKLFEPAVPVVIKYIEVICNDVDEHLWEDTIAAAAGLIGDLCVVYGAEVRKTVTELPAVVAMVERVKGLNNSSKLFGLYNLKLTEMSEESYCQYLRPTQSVCVWSLARIMAKN